MHIQLEVLPLLGEMIKLDTFYAKYLLIVMHKRKGWKPGTVMLLLTEPPFNSNFCLKEMSCHV